MKFDRNPSVNCLVVVLTNEPTNKPAKLIYLPSTSEITVRSHHHTDTRIVYRVTYVLVVRVPYAVPSWQCKSPHYESRKLCTPDREGEGINEDYKGSSGSNKPAFNCEIKFI